MHCIQTGSGALATGSHFLPTLIVIAMTRTPGAVTPPSIDEDQRRVSLALTVWVAQIVSLGSVERR
jgi:hypothetical protein